MTLAFRYQFWAPAEATAGELATFLHRVEAEVQKMGFEATAVVDIQFHPIERAQFFRRSADPSWSQDQPLQDANPLGIGRFARTDGARLLPPIGGVALVVRDESGHEACFGFMKYPESMQTADGAVVVESGLKGTWYFGGYVQTRDQRYRAIVQRFVEAGYATRVDDDFPSQTTSAGRADPTQQPVHGG